MTTIENAVTRVGPGTAQKGQRNKNSAANITQLPTPQRVRSGILSYRQQRSVADFSHVIRQALEREAALREQAGTPDQWLREAAAWIDRGCLPQ